jgi:hypothetical protein
MPSGDTTMIRSPGNAAVAALLILGAASAHADVLSVSMVAQNPAYSSFGLSFDLDTAATVDTIGTGGCYFGCLPAGTYTTFSATGGISNASLTWNGVDYSLQNSNIFLDWQGGNAFDLDMHLTFNNNTTLFMDDQPTGGPYSDSQYNPSQMLTTAMLTSYNGYSSGLLQVDGGSRGGFLGGIKVETTPVSVPEPDTLALFAAGLAGVAALKLVRRRNGGANEGLGASDRVSIQ